MYYIPYIRRAKYYKQIFLKKNKKLSTMSYGYGGGGGGGGGGNSGKTFILISFILGSYITFFKKN